MIVESHDQPRPVRRFLTNPLFMGALAGLVFGALAAISMMPLSFPDKRAALTGAFINRFSIGLMVGAVMGAPRVAALGLSSWLIGLGVGLLLSLADAVITKAYVPILSIGVLGGSVIGWLIGRFAS
jgi:hypothetical protein